MARRPSPQRGASPRPRPARNTPQSAAVRRVFEDADGPLSVQEARDRGMLIDATFGRKTASVLVMDSDHVVLSALAAERLAPRLGLTVKDMTEEDV